MPSSNLGPVGKWVGTLVTAGGERLKREEAGEEQQKKRKSPEQCDSEGWLMVNDM